MTDNKRNCRLKRSLELTLIESSQVYNSRLQRIGANFEKGERQLGIAMNTTILMQYTPNNLQ